MRVYAVRRYVKVAPRGNRRAMCASALIGIAVILEVWAAAGTTVTSHSASSASPVKFASHVSSGNVAFIGSAASANGGALFHSNAAFSSMTFSNLLPTAVDAQSLAAFDTVVLNVASAEMACKTSTLSSGAKNALVGWLGAGNKLVIWDSECPPQDYSWLPLPFTTSNPGPNGAPGTLTIVEDDSLASGDSSSAKYIHAVPIATDTDAVGDSNVLVTRDPRWCVNETAVNTKGAAGPVHVYGTYENGSHAGLLIYNGMDMDDMGATPDTSNGPNNMNKQFLQELQQPFDPAVGLPCAVTVVGITLKPDNATNPVGTSHTVTAHVMDQLNAPRQHVAVSFVFESGSVNHGQAGTCTPNADCTSDANGNVSFTYKDTHGPGMDTIKACFTPPDSESAVCSTDVTKTWKASETSSSSSSTSTSTSISSTSTSTTTTDPIGPQGSTATTSTSVVRVLPDATTDPSNTGSLPFTGGDPGDAAATGLLFLGIGLLLAFRRRWRDS